jgi:hypothetical protein
MSALNFDFCFFIIFFLIMLTVGFGSVGWMVRTYDEAKVIIARKKPAHNDLSSIWTPRANAQKNE